MVTPADGMPASAAYAQTRPPTAERIETSSHYLTMRDGVRIAVEVHLPAPRGDARLPALIRQTRYFRAFERTALGRLLGEARADPINGRMRRFFVSRGYAWVDVDVRGSGASTGVWHSPWSPLEVADGPEIVDWIVAQPWSNGRVGATGNSYDGTAAELLASQGHPALRACAPRCSLYDVYTDIAYPGGVHQDWFTGSWTRINQGLDCNHPERMVGEAIAQGHPWWERGARRRLLESAVRLFIREVRPVDGDRAALAAALADHARNIDLDAVSRTVEFRDDQHPTPIGPRTIDAFSPSAYVDSQRTAGVPMLSISGWFDGAYPHAAIKRHLTLDRPGNCLVLGPWNHGVSLNLSPHAASRTAGYPLDGELLRFFDHHLLDRDTGIAAEAAVRYYVMGAEAWRTAPAWPPPDVEPRRLYLAGGRALAWTAPAEGGRDELVANPAVGTGRRSRWRTLVSPFVVADYPDRERRDRDLLVYRSRPLDQDLEIAGHPLVWLHVAADAADGALFAYLEEEIDGRVCYVTEGQLRLVHPVVDGVAPRFRSPAPYRSFARADARPLVPGAVAQVVVDLLPVAYRFARGGRIRLALATADADHFAPVPGGARGLRIEHGPAYPSALELPSRCR